MTAPSAARGGVGPVIVVATAVLIAGGCGRGGDVGTGSRSGGESEGEVDTGDTNPPAASGRVASVERVIDGDSIELSVSGVEVELRLEGYNAPELYADNVDGADSQTCNGLAARSAVDVAIEGAATIEVVEGDTDRFGRTLGDLVIDGESLVRRLIGDGHGLATGDDGGLRARMVEAASAGLGVWGEACGLPASRELAIGTVQVDAPGNDRYNLTEEFVEVVNAGSRPVELEGWVLRDDTTSHQFPLPGTLAAGERLTVVTGAAPPQAEGDRVHYLGESFPVWSNAWETVVLVDPSGVFADWRFVADGLVVLQ